MGVVDSSIFNNKQAKSRHSLQFWRLWACLLPSLQQRQRLLHGTDMVASMATASQPMEAMAMVDTMARDLLTPSPRPRLMPGTDMVAFTAMASQLMADMAMVDTMARGLLMPNPRLRLMLGTDMVAFTDMASQPMADMAMVDTTARSKILSLTTPTVSTKVHTPKIFKL